MKTEKNFATVNGLSAVEADPPASRPRLGFLGLGGMGSRMAGRLLDAGYSLTVFNRSRERTRPLQGRGATVAPTPAGVARDAEIVLVCVADDAAAESVITGREGALSGARRGSTIVDLSTVSPALSRRVAEMGRAQGVSVLDAPVSGSTPQAQDGQLVIFVGGASAAYERCRPLLAVLGRESFYLGETGSGSTMKLCVNALLGVGMQALAEAIALGLKSGLERDRLLDVLGATVVLSESQRSKLANAREDAYPATFPLRLMSKDFGLILETARSLSVTMPATASAEQVCAAEAARQRASGRDEDFSAVVRAMEEAAGAGRTDDVQAHSTSVAESGT
jgi:3-hydroxyisobutyrate dehydrogenase-like beta-hydroxyacid dehydrogenase